MQYSGETQSSYFWQGSQVRLRPIQSSDWQTIYTEQEDSEGLRVLEPGIQLPRSPERVQEFVNTWHKALANPEKTSWLPFAVESLAGEFVGMANIHGYNPQHGTFSFAIRIFRPFRGHGYAKEAVRILLRYGFLELRCQKANSETIDTNNVSVHLHEVLGFKVEGRRRRNVYTGGTYHDEVLFGMTREEFDDVEPKLSASS